MKNITIGQKEMTIEEVKKEILEKLEKITKDEEFKNLVRAVISEKNGQKGPRENSKQSMFKEMLLAGPVSEEKLWEDWKWGRHEALSVAWYYRQEKVAENDRLWVWFNLTTRCYEIIGKGTEVPEYYKKKKDNKKAKSEIEVV